VLYLRTFTQQFRNGKIPLTDSNFISNKLSSQTSVASHHDDNNLFQMIQSGIFSGKDDT
jgi:hypothetical protein